MQSINLNEEFIMTRTFAFTTLVAAVVLVGLTAGADALPMNKPKDCYSRGGSFFDVVNCMGGGSPNNGGSGAGGFTVKPSGTVIFDGDKITGRRPGRCATC